MFFQQGIEEPEEERVNIIIRIKIAIHKNHIIIKEMHPLQEEEKEVQFELEEEEEKDFMKEQEEDMDPEKYEDHHVIIIINLVILKILLCKIVRYGK
jgi:hypothetical protein